MYYREPDEAYKELEVCSCGWCGRDIEEGDMVVQTKEGWRLLSCIINELEDDDVENEDAVLDAECEAISYTYLD